jgi:hypothetical protein
VIDVPTNPTMKSCPIFSREVMKSFQCLDQGSGLCGLPSCTAVLALTYL